MNVSIAEKTVIGVCVRMNVKIKCGFWSDNNASTILIPFVFRSDDNVVLNKFICLRCLAIRMKTRIEEYNDELKELSSLTWREQ